MDVRGLTIIKLKTKEGERKGYTRTATQPIEKCTTRMTGPIASRNVNPPHQNEEALVYIRRGDGEGWVRGRTHHERAYEVYRASYLRGEGSYLISVAHTDGGDFVATFYPQMGIMAMYEDEYGNRVEITRMEPSRAAFINRLTV